MDETNEAGDSDSSKPAAAPTVGQPEALKSPPKSRRGRPPKRGPEGSNAKDLLLDAIEAVGSREIGDALAAEEGKDLPARGEFELHLAAAEAASNREERAKEAEHVRKEGRKAAEHDRQEKQKDAEHERFKDKWSFLFSSIGLIATSLICLIALLVGGEAAQRWAVPLLTLIIGGWVGYQKGATSRKKPKT